MANDLNQCNFIGNLGKDVETRFTPSGKEVCTFSIACGRKYNGNEETTWVNIVAWDKLANICASYLKKGSKVFISGRMVSRSYDDRDGNKRYITEIVADQMQMLGSRDDNQSGGQQQSQQQQQNKQGNQQQGFNPDDEIPF